MVYNSWLTMQSKGEADADTCAYNDLALVQVDPADAGRSTRRSRTGAARRRVSSAGTATGDTVLSYGNSELRGGVTQLVPKRA